MTHELRIYREFVPLVQFSLCPPCQRPCCTVLSLLIHYAPYRPWVVTRNFSIVPRVFSFMFQPWCAVIMRPGIAPNRWRDICCITTSDERPSSPASLNAPFVPRRLDNSGAGLPLGRLLTDVDESSVFVPIPTCQALGAVMPPFGLMPDAHRVTHSPQSKSFKVPNLHRIFLSNRGHDLSRW